MSTPAKLIQYTPQQLRVEFLELLQDLSAEIQTESITSILGKDLIKDIRTRFHQIQPRLNQEFSLVVVGDFKRGKSTLINALLKTPVVTTNVLPETVTINEIQYGSEFKIYACLLDGGHITIESSELNSEKLLPIIEQYPNQISHLKIEVPVEWLRGVRLVDTPGTGDIFKRFDSQVHAYLKQADVVLWVISALSPLSESEQSFLRLSILPQDFPKLFFIVNMMDNISREEDAERLLNAMQAKISRIFPNAHMFGLSALDEFCRTQSLSRAVASKLETSFQTFRDCLQESIILNRDVILLERVAMQIEQLLKGVESKISLLQDAINADPLRLKSAIAQCENHTSELYSRIAQHQQQMRDKIATLSEETRGWMNEFIQRLEKDAIASLTNFDLNDIRRDFQFFLTDKLRQAIQLCLDTHQPAIIEIAEDAKMSIFEDFHQLTDIRITGVDIASTTSATLTDMQWTDLDTLHLVIELTPMGVFVKVLAKIFTEQQKNNLKQSKETINYRHRLQASLLELQHSISQYIDEIYIQITANVEKQIEQLYQQDIEASQAAMKQAQELGNSNKEKLTYAREGLEAALLLVTDTHNNLKWFRQKVQCVISQI